jgi:hypothetical protein
MKEEKITSIMKEEKLKEGTKIIYNGDNYVINGEIVGLADNGNPVVGYNYIIKILEFVGERSYNYSCTVLPRLMFDIVD